MKHFGIFKVIFPTIRFKIYLWPHNTLISGTGAQEKGNLLYKIERAFQFQTDCHQSRKEMPAFPAATLSGPSDFLASPRPGQFNGFS